MGETPPVDTARVLYTGRLACDAGWSMASHLHPAHELVVVLRGRFHAVIGGERNAAGPGDILFYRGGVPHEEWADRDDPATTVYIGFAWPDAPAGFPTRGHDRRGRIGQYARWLYEDREPAPAAVGPGRELLALILREVLHDASGQEAPLVREVRRFLAERLADDLSLDDIARHAGLSKYHFVRRYGELAGRTPAEELRRLRLEHARHLILTTNLPLKAIPPLAGLRDQHHMTRLFRRHLGMTPGQLRRKT